MQFATTQKDPLEVLSSTKFIVENLQHVKIHVNKINDLSKIINNKLREGLDEVADLRYVNMEELNKMIADPKNCWTPVARDTFTRILFKD